MKLCEDPSAFIDLLVFKHIKGASILHQNCIDLTLVELINVYFMPTKLQIHTTCSSKVLNIYSYTYYIIFLNFY